MQILYKFINNLQCIANYFKKWYNYIGGNPMIERKEYLDRLKKWKDKDLIKVITGIRRCGKSTLFKLYIR